MTASKAMNTIGRVVGAALLRLSAGWQEFGVVAHQAIARILGGIRKLVVAWMEIPFINPAAKALGQIALNNIDMAMGGIAISAALAKLEAQHLNTQADALLAPIVAAKNALVEMQSEWITVGGAADAAADQVVVSITRAGEEIKGKLRGGFGEGVEEGVEDAKVIYKNLSDWVTANPLRPEIDMEYVQRQFAEIGLAPDTGGAVP